MGRPVLIAAVLALSACSGGEKRLLPLNLPQDPYLGLKCRNAAVCDRIGIAVWVRRPARSVSATVHGHVVVLHTGHGTGAYRRGLFWEGVFRDHAAARTAGDLSLRRRVHVVVLGDDGKRRSRVVYVAISSGYG